MSGAEEDGNKKKREWESSGCEGKGTIVSRGKKVRKEGKLNRVAYPSY